MLELHYNDNMKVEIKIPIDLVYADYIYGNTDFSWIDNTGIFYNQMEFSWHKLMIPLSPFKNIS